MTVAVCWPGSVCAAVDVQHCSDYGLRSFDVDAPACAAGGSRADRGGGQGGVPHGSLAMRVRDELGQVFADGAFIDAFGIRGRPGISPGQLALVTVLQFVENLTDRQAADAVRARIDWKYALPGVDRRGI